MTLFEDSDNEEEVKEEKVTKEEFPSLCEQKNTAEVKTGWAAIAAIPKKIVEEPKQKILVPVHFKVEKNLKSWADWSDSESEEDEEDEEDIQDFNCYNEFNDDTW